MRVRVLLAILAASVIGSTISARAEEAPFHLEPTLRELWRAPWTRISISLGPTGITKTVFEFPGPVLFSVEKDGIVSEDNSGHGAMLCNLEMGLAFMTRLDDCDSTEDNYFRSIAERGLDKIADFIVANSITGVRKSDLMAYIAKRREPHKENASENTPDEKRKYCEDEILTKIRAALVKETRESIETWLSDPRVLGPSRPPAMNPCL